MAVLLDGVFVRRWIRELLERKRDREDDYDIAIKRYLARKPRKIDWAGGRRPSRDELYVRWPAAE
ncbi:MAG: hypothetical protein OXU74_16415 [Gemmatimonadota bacterium]|nr:hypothetical protein [Gemmatimonadota bacterium]